MGLQMSFIASVFGAYTGANALEAVAATLHEKGEVDLTTGSGASGADRAFTDNRTLAASASENLDLNGTMLNDAFGAPLSLLRVKGIMIKANAANTNDVVVGGAGSNALATLFGTTSDAIHIRPGGFFMIATPDPTGYVVTPSTGDLLKVANGGSGSTVNYDVVIIGAAE